MSQISQDTLPLCPINVAAAKRRFEAFQAGQGEWANRPVFDRLLLNILKGKRRLRLEIAFDVLESNIRVAKNKVEQSGSCEDSAILELGMSLHFWGASTYETRMDDARALFEESRDAAFAAMPFRFLPHQYDQSVPPCSDGAGVTAGKDRHLLGDRK